MKVLLLQLDGKFPNLALMRIAAHHRALGDSVELSHGAAFGGLFYTPDQVYASAIFKDSIPLAMRVKREYPDAIIGGTGWDATRKVSHFHIEERGTLDYSLWPRFRQSIGFTQRGCRLKCSFCVVPGKEGAVSEEKTIAELWRGDPWPRELVLLDNDFFGQPNWRARINEMREGKFKVSFSQGINARFLTDEAAEAIASVDYRAWRNGTMQDRCIYTAWDNKGDEARLMAGLKRLVKYGVKPDHIMVYMLCGYWPGETHEDREHRRKTLRDFGARPYPMPYTRTPELVGYQRWTVRRADLKMSWAEFAKANYRPEKVKRSEPMFPMFAETA